MIDVTGKLHEATDVEGHPTRPHGTGGQWRNELADAIVERVRCVRPPESWRGSWG